MSIHNSYKQSNEFGTSDSIDQEKNLTTHPGARNPVSQVFSSVIGLTRFLGPTIAGTGLATVQTLSMNVTEQPNSPLIPVLLFAAGAGIYEGLRHLAYRPVTDSNSFASAHMHPSVDRRGFFNIVYRYGVAAAALTIPISQSLKTFNTPAPLAESCRIKAPETPPESLTQKIILKVTSGSNPRRILGWLLDGKIDVTDDNGEKVEVNTPIEIVRYLAEDLIPVRFVNPLNGTEEFRINGKLFFPTNLNERQINWIDSIEGPAYDLQDGVQTLIKRVAKRTVEGTITGESTGNGSDQIMSFVGLLAGKEALHPDPLRSASVLNPRDTNILYQPQEYSLTYALLLCDRIAANEMPDALSEVMSNTHRLRRPSPSLIHSLLSQGIRIDDICSQLEKLAASLRLQSNYTWQAITGELANVVPLGTTQDTGLEIFGVGALGLYYFGKEDFQELTMAQQIVILATWAAAGEYSKDLVTNYGNKKNSELLIITKVRKHILPRLLEDGQITEAERQSVDDELETLKFTLYTPLRYRHMAFNPDYGLSQRETELIASVAWPGKRPYYHLADKYDFREVIIPFNMAEITFAQSPSRDIPDIVSQFNGRTRYGFELRGLIGEWRENKGFFSRIIKIGKQEFPIRVPKHMGNQLGLGVSVAGTSTDGAPQVFGNEGLINTRFVPGSSIKPFIAAAYAMVMADNGTPIDLTSDKISTVPGPWGLATGSFITNAVKLGKQYDNVTFAQALKWSLNVPWNIALQQISCAELQEKLKLFGIQLTDQFGNVLKEYTEQMGFGNDVFVDSVDGGPALNAYARAGLAFMTPDQFSGISTNSSYLRICRDVGTIMFDDKYFLDSQGNFGPVWSKRSRGLLSAVSIDSDYELAIKTGTAFRAVDAAGNNATTGTYTLVLAKHKHTGKGICVALQMTGINPNNGRYIPLEWIDGADSSKYDLPLARLIAEEMKNVKIETNTVHIQTSSLMGGIWKQRPLFTSKRSIGKISRSLKVSDPAGEFELTENQIVDLVGSSRRGMQRIAWKIGSEVFSADVSINDLSTFETTIEFNSEQHKTLIDAIKSINARYSKQPVSSRSRTEVINASKARLENYQIIVLTSNISSPALASVYEVMKRRELVAAGPELTSTLCEVHGLPENIVFVCLDEADKYLNDNAGLREVVGRSLEFSKRMSRLQILMDQAGYAVNLDKLFWNNQSPTPVSRLLNVFADLGLDTTRVFNTRAIMRRLSFPGKNDIAPEALSRMEKIFLTYSNLIGNYDRGGEISIETAKRFLQLVNEFNSDPTDLELELLSLASFKN